jgi:hypothetical protein
MIRVLRHTHTRNILLMLAMFFNPFGFDALFALVMEWTGSYWTTDFVFYCLSGLFFGLYYLHAKFYPYEKDTI